MNFTTPLNERPAAACCCMGCITEQLHGTWRPADATPATLDLANIVGAIHVSSQAELAFHNVTVSLLLPIPRAPFAVALLHCSV